MIWTSDLDLILKENYVYVTASRIAETLSELTGHNVTKSAVIGRSRRIGLSNKDRNPLKTPILYEPMAHETGEGIHPTEIRNGLCRWPIGDPKHEDFCFCGKATDKHVYCPEHKKIAFMSEKRLTLANKRTNLGITE